jgi:hypothetical protein
MPYSESKHPIVETDEVVVDMYKMVLGFNLVKSGVFCILHFYQKIIGKDEKIHLRIAIILILCIMCTSYGLLILVELFLFKEADNARLLIS